MDGSDAFCHDGNCPHMAEKGILRGGCKHSTYPATAALPQWGRTVTFKVTFEEEFFLRVCGKGGG